MHFKGKFRIRPIRHLEPFDPKFLTDAVFVRRLLVAGELKMHGMWRSLGFNWCYLWKVLKLNLPNYGFLKFLTSKDRIETRGI